MLVVMGNPANTLMALADLPHCALSTSQSQGLDFQGISLRLADREIRDAILVVGNLAENPLIFLMHRAKPAPQESLIDSYIRRGGGGVLRVDDCRIGTTDILRGGAGVLRSHFRGNTRDKARPQQNTAGRFPANVMLEHRPPCVKMKSTRKVGSGPAGGYVYRDSVYKVRGFVGECKPLSASNRGTEEAPNWDCTPDCPVGLLDKQSGITQSGQVLPHYTRNPGAQLSSGGICQTGLKSIPLTGYGDKGGTSRFYKQTKTREETLGYLATLVNTHRFK